jgi:dehypoxanthine futalosine cyclase
MSAQRLDRATLLELLTNASLIELMARANALRQQWHPGNEVTFVIDTNPNYTNVCTTACTFCAFYRKPGDPESYVLSPQAVATRIAQAASQGATTALLQGGHHPDLPLQYYLDIIAAVRQAAPAIHCHFFSPAEIANIAEVAGMPYTDVLARLFEAGQRTMPGGGAEILADPVRRRISPKKISAGRWLNIMRAAHRLGIKTSATMTYGHLESPHDIIEHLLKLRQLQDETGGFYAFIPWSFKPGHTPLSRLVPESALPSAYPRIIALSRLALDNFPHIQASWFGEGWRAGQLALHAGADDFGGLLIEENVLRNAGHAYATSKDAILQIIQSAGFLPVQRNTLYHKLLPQPATPHGQPATPVFARQTP